MAKGILIAVMDFSDVAEDEFHDWYDTEHVPERLRVPGFLNAERWIGSQNPKVSVALYDLDDVGILHSPPYLAVGGDNGTPWTKRVTGRTRAMFCASTTAPTGVKPDRFAVARVARLRGAPGGASPRWPRCR